MQDEEPLPEAAVSEGQLSESTHSEPRSPQSAMQGQATADPSAVQPTTPITGFVRVQPTAARGQGSAALWQPRPRPASASDLQALAHGIGALASAPHKGLQVLRWAAACLWTVLCSFPADLPISSLLFACGAMRHMLADAGSSGPAELSLFLFTLC